MASELQIAANQRNALLSTGPRSTDGKARSSQNAVTHGLTAQRVLLPARMPGDLRRCEKKCIGLLSPLAVDIDADRLGMGLRDELDKELLRAANAVAEVFKVLLNRDLLSKLNRYESSLQKQLTMTLKELRELSLKRAAPEAKALRICPELVPTLRNGKLRFFVGAPVVSRARRRP